MKTTTRETVSVREHPTIGELVANDWRNAEVFNRYGIDYCCGGKRTVLEACEKKQVDAAQVELELQQVAERPALSGVEGPALSGVEGPSPGGLDFSQWELDSLVDHIVSTHHKYVAEAIPFLNNISQKVAKVHGESHPELLEIRYYTRYVTEELATHMQKEEIVLFPYIKELVEVARSGKSLDLPNFGSIANPVRMMEDEHTLAGTAMESIDALTSHFNPPGDACTSYRVLFSKLHEFQQDLRMHVHLENNILFPRALKLEEELLGSSR